VDISEVVQIVGEGALEFGRDYPPMRASVPAGASVGPPTFILISIGAEDASRVDRYLLGAVRLVLPTAAAIRPYAELGAGWGRNREILDFGSGPATYSNAFGFGILGGGVTARIGDRLEAGVGYRFTPETDNGPTVSSIHAELGVVFK
jgi:opacity protein-like surface antigen